MRTYGSVTRNRDAWVIDAEPHIHMRLKRVFAKLSKQAQHRLVLTHSPEVCRDLEWFMERYPLQMSESDRMCLTTAANSYREQIARLEELIDPSYVPPEFALAMQPRDYQRRGAAICLKTGGVLIADDVGLGKTVTAICLFAGENTLPAVVVTLAHLPNQWAYEVGKFAPGLFVHVLRKATPYELPRFMGRGPDVIVTNYHKLAGWSKTLSAYAKTVVFDEMQELRKVGSQKYSAAYGLCEAMTVRCGLSATPVYNYGGEIFNILNLLRPGALGSRAEFSTEWCASGGGEDAIIKNPKAFGAWAREQFLIVRHTRKEVGRELPAVTRIPQTIDSDPDALNRVGDAAAELARIILGQAMSAQGDRFRAAQELSLLLRQATGIAKAPHVAAFVRMLVESGESVVVFAWHREVYRVLQSQLADFRPVMYTGTESPTEKAMSLKRFKAGESKVFLMSLRSGAGLNGLQECSSIAVFAELDWSPGVHEQCIGRLNRDGQDTPVLAYFLVAEDGSDPVVAEMLGLKREQIEGIRNPTEEVLEELQVDPAHVRKLAEHYLQSRGLATAEVGA